MNHLNTLEKNLTEEYRMQHRALLSTSKKQLDTPSSENIYEIQYISGYLDGLKRALSFVADAQNDNQFNF